MNQIDRGHIDYKSEVLRKSIHLCSLSIPVIYYFITKETALGILIPLAVFSLILDLARYKKDTKLNQYFHAVFGFMLREHEKDLNKKNLNGATYVLLSAVIVILIFPKVLVVTAFAVLIVGDIAAALIGRKFGKTRFLDKSLQGTLAFFFFSCIVVFLTPKVNGIYQEYLIGIVAVAIGAIAENVSSRFADDNLVIPISVSLAMLLMYHFLLPDMALVLANVPN
ncbi:dolichol kinase [bacterium BRH_c32]|nr:MAG: dolichol kinase [bacterium BRH_c32]